MHLLRKCIYFVSIMVVVRERNGVSIGFPGASTLIQSVVSYFGCSTTHTLVLPLVPLTTTMPWRLSSFGFLTWRRACYDDVKHHDHLASKDAHDSQVICMFGLVVTPATALFAGFDGKTMVAALWPVMMIMILARHIVNRGVEKRSSCVK